MIDMGWLGHIECSWAFVTAVFSIVLIDLVLAGDNAVVIAMAVKNLSARQRRWGIVLGAGGAVVIRVLCTFLVSQLLVMQFIKLAGGLIIIWIAVKLLVQSGGEQHQVQAAGGLVQALWVIIVADLSMGIDNMLAVGAASHGNMFLLLFGLALSIPFVVFMSDMLARLMDRFPVILWIGAAILGRVGGEMMISDPWVVGLLQPSRLFTYGVEAFFVLFVCGVAKLLLRRREAAARAAAQAA